MGLGNTVRSNYPIELLHTESYQILNVVLKIFYTKDKAAYSEFK